MAGGFRTQHAGQKSLSSICSTVLGISEQTLSNWRKASKAGKLAAGTGKAITPEQMELSRLRAENARLKMELEILEKATAYFAKRSQ